MSLARRIFAEGLGTALLLAVVVGSGIMGERLAAGNEAITLLANSLVTGAGLFVLISILGPISGAHFNPIVTAAMAWRRDLRAREAMGYVVVQVIGAVLGVVLANLMFDLAPIALSAKERSGTGLWISEIVATSGLLLTVLLGLRHRPAAIPTLVAAYITAAFWFTASTSFANPAVTLARSLTPTFTGIRLGDVLPFVVAQGIGLVVGLFAYAALSPAEARYRAYPGQSPMALGDLSTKSKSQPQSPQPPMR